MKVSKKTREALEVVLHITFYIAIVVGTFCLSSYITMLLWNWIIASLFNIREITFAESLGVTLILMMLGQVAYRGPQQRDRGTL